MTTTYRVSASSKLVKRLQNLFDIIQTASSWTNDNGVAKREDLLLASFKVSEQSIKEGFAFERYLGPAIHSWLFIHAQDYVDSPGDIPVDFFVLDHLHSKLPPLLDPSLRKKLEKARRDSPPSLANVPAPLAKAEPQPTKASDAKGKSKAKADDEKDAKATRVKEEKGVKLKEEKVAKVKEARVVKGKEVKEVTQDKGKGKAQQSTQKNDGPPSSKSKVPTSKPSTSVKRRPVSSSSSEDNTLPDPHTLKQVDPAPPSKKTKRVPSPDPSLAAMDIDSNPPGDDDDDGIQGYWARLPRSDEIPTGDLTFDLAEVIHNFKHLYSKVTTVQAHYDTLVVSSEETRKDVRHLKQQKVDPIQVLAHEQKMDMLTDDIRKLTQETADLKAAISNLTIDGEKFKTLTDSVHKLTKDNSDLRTALGKLTGDLQALTSSISNRTDLVFDDGMDVTSGQHTGYSSVAYDPQFLPFLNNHND